MAGSAFGRLLALTAAAAALAACGQGAAQQSVGSGSPVSASPETRRPNTHYQPAFAGQTRAPLARSGVAFERQVIARGLDHPWAVEVMGDGRMLVTERPGRLRIVGRDGRMSPPVQGLPLVFAKSQGGLLDVAVGPDGLTYWSYAEGRPDGDGTAVARGRLVEGAQPRMDGVQVIFRMQPTLKSGMHFGSRLVFAPDGKLFITLGERSILPGRVQAQRLDSHFGKIVRINPDGSVPSDNPFVGRQGARPEIWSIGQRNIQAAALDPQGRLWEVEHGPLGGDELNRTQKGKDYGWPTISYGNEYSGSPIGAGRTQAPGMEQPVYYWDPVIAPSGMVFYTGELFPAWKGSLFVGSLKDQKLVRLEMREDRVVGEEWFDIGQRVRDVSQGADGALYLVTDEDDGRLIRLAPKR